MHEPNFWQHTHRHTRVEPYPHSVAPVQLDSQVASPATSRRILGELRQAVAALPPCNDQCFLSCVFTSKAQVQLDSVTSNELGDPGSFNRQ